MSSNPTPSVHQAAANASRSAMPSKSSNKSEGRKRDKKDRPCDACRRRKSKCVLTEGQPACVACAMHGQNCTFLEDPKPRKRRVEAEDKQHDQAKKRANPGPTSKSSKKAAKETFVKSEDSESSSSSVGASPNSWQHHGYHVGYTTELEPMLFDISRSTGPTVWSANYQKSDERNAFLTFGSPNPANPQSVLSQSVEKLVGPNGPLLLRHFQLAISRSFPIIEDSTLSPNQRKNLDPALLCAIYLVSASSPGSVGDKKKGVDAQELEDLALNLISESLKKPTLATIQAGLLLMQRSDIDSKTLNTQLVSAAFELGLHLDCAAWPLSTEERGLRKRLAWAVYMQDQWCSLTHGRPSLISRANWAVQDLFDEDFDLGDASTNGDTALAERKRGLECFCEMVALTEILSSILETFYTQMAMQEYDAAGENGTRLILERAKPVQMRLKDWFTRLPKDLKLDNGQAPSLIGHLHLAYFATEITLHRCIIRSLANASSDQYLSYICRGAAKSRLISAMDFVNRLRSDHLQSFWYFPSKVNFALVATFGSLLLATAPTQEEAEFYQARLREYRWTLSVSAKNAGFLHFAIESLESSADLLKALPSKPKLEELDLRTMPPPPLPIPHLIPPSEASKDNSEGDDAMTDAPPEPIHSSAFMSQSFVDGLSSWPGELMSPVTESTEPMPAFTFQSDLLNSNTPDIRRISGPFAGTPFEGLTARNWFDNSHHGSPEAEQLGMVYE